MHIQYTHSQNWQGLSTATLEVLKYMCRNNNDIINTNTQVKGTTIIIASAMGTRTHRAVTGYPEGGHYGRQGGGEKTGSNGHPPRHQRIGDYGR